MVNLVTDVSCQPGQTYSQPREHAQTENPERRSSNPALVEEHEPAIPAQTETCRFATSHVLPQQMHLSAQRVSEAVSPVSIIVMLARHLVCHKSRRERDALNKYSQNEQQQCDLSYPGAFCPIRVRIAGKHRPQREAEQHDRRNHIPWPHAISTFPLCVSGKENEIHWRKQHRHRCRATLQFPQSTQSSQRQDHRRRENKYRLAGRQEKSVEAFQERRIKSIQALGAFGCRRISKLKRAAKQQRIMHKESQHSDR